MFMKEFVAEPLTTRILADVWGRIEYYVGC